jgi:predicted nucleotidyltransferase
LNAAELREARMQMFTEQEREHIREELVSAAAEDVRIIGAAHLGSAASGRLDQWSDIDLALCLAADADFDKVLLDWTQRMYRDHAAVTNYDVRRGTILYRVFLLNNTLQVDLSFWHATEFRAVGPKFSLIFGASGEPIPAPQPDSMDMIGMAWLYALHVRSSIARGRALQAEHVLSGMRDSVLALACQRHGVAAVQGRGLDDLPEELRIQAAGCLPQSLEPVELKRAFRATTDILLDEIRYADATLAAKLTAPLNIVVGCLDVD